jgi:hypothetical protein
MSARALMNDLGIVEIPMQYSERVGESKLRVLKDGFRFLRAIWEAMLIFRPSRIFLLLTMFCALVGLAWGLFPIEFYVREGRLEEWMIYRVLLCTFLFTCSFVFLCAGVIGDQIMGLVHRQRWRSFLSQAFDRLLSPRALIVTAGGSAAVAIALVWPGLMEYLRTGHITLHWSRAIVAVFLLHVSLFAVVTSVLRSILNLWKGQLDYVRRHH